MNPTNFLTPELIEKMQTPTKGYSVYNVLYDKKGVPVVIQMSASSDPPHWYVQDGRNSLFFLTYREMMDYVKERGLVPERKTNQKNKNHL